MRFKLDENLPAEAAAYLREQGHEADSVFEEGLAGSPDSKISEICRIESRILVTLDLDFADVRTYPPRESCGVIVLRLASPDRQSVLNILPRVLTLLLTEPVRERLWIVDEKRTRIRGE